MKKTLIFLLVFLILISSTAFAQDRTTQQARQKRIAVFSAAQTVEQNRAAIKLITDEVNEKVKATKLKIKALLENKEDLTKDQLILLKKSLTQIKAHQASLKDTFGQIKAYNEDVKLARNNKDFDQLLILYNEIIAIQEIRINDLTQYNDTLDVMLNIL